jgi:hypothetical protein
LKILQRPKSINNQQKDADRRDRLLEAEDGKSVGRKNVIPSPKLAIHHIPPIPGPITAERKRKNDVSFPELNAEPLKGSLRKRVRILHRPKSTETINRREALAKMNDALKDPGWDLEPDTPTKESLLDRLGKKSLPTVDICGITGVSFHRYMKKAESEIFFISLAEIKRVIEDRL